MKRIFAGLLAVLLCSVLVVGSAAADDRETIRLPELGLELDLWNDYVIFTRNIDRNDPNLEEYGLTKEDLYGMMLEGNIYLDAWDKDMTWEIVISMKEAPVKDYCKLSDTTLSLLASGVKNEYVKSGVGFLNFEICQYDQMKFIKLYYVDRGSESTTYSLQYQTVHDGKSIFITLNSFYSPIDTWAESIMKNIVSSIRFDTAPEIEEVPDGTDSFVYKDTETGVSFTVPENWVQRKIGEGGELEARFASIYDDAMKISYTREDLWAKLPEAEKKALSREDADNSMMSTADVAEVLGCKEKDISVLTLAGREYFRAEVKVTVELMGYDVLMPVASLVRCEDGIMYVYQFSGTSDMDCYGDFISLVESVQYPADKEKSTGEENRGGAILIVICMAVFCGGLIFGIAFFVISKLREKKKTIEEPARKKEPHEHKIAFCHMCGNKLPEGSSFCNVCGTQIPDEL